MVSKKSDRSKISYFCDDEKYTTSDSCLPNGRFAVGFHHIVDGR
jgi:hypothetical protein